VGIVGAKLLYPNGQIQHAGVVFGLQGFVDHLYMNVPQDYCGLIGSVNWYRNVSAVTGACQMMRHTVFDELSGYDENYCLVFSDVEICLRATQKNYRIVYTPFAKLIHHQGMSRGRKTPTNDLALGLKYLTSIFDGNDPYFSPNLTYTYIPHCQTKPESGDDRMVWMRKKQAILERWKDR
jgi:GT2 family glycosyltransferase